MLSKQKFAVITLTCAFAGWASTTSAAVVLTVDDSNPAAVTITATGALSLADYTGGESNFGVAL